MFVRRLAALFTYQRMDVGGVLAVQDEAQASVKGHPHQCGVLTHVGAERRLQQALMEHHLRDPKASQQSQLGRYRSEWASWTL